MIQNPRVKLIHHILVYAVLTVGAANSGSAFAGHGHQGLVDPFTDEELPSIISAMGLGYLKTVKPDLLVDEAGLRYVFLPGPAKTR